VQQPSDLETVRESYDRVADAYVELAMGRLEAEPWLRAVLAAFAESVRGLGPVVDVGCGPGTVTAHLTELGLDASGIDLSPRMIEHARRQYPDLRFSVASATELDLAPASLGGVLGWWSLFNLPREALPGVLLAFAEALVPAARRWSARTSATAMSCGPWGTAACRCRGRPTSTVPKRWPGCCSTPVSR
jgi:SAM-dependent methyltransferase